MNRILAAATLAAAFAGSLAAQAARPCSLVAVLAGRPLDVAIRDVRTHAVIVIEDGRVRSIETAPPAGAQLIDLGGDAVAPGFIAAHTHVLLQGDATAEDYDAQLLEESVAYRAL
jgi:imidazolonepropionase-like amidohydrolase